MKRYLHLSLSGQRYLTYALGTGRNDQSCLEEYLASLSRQSVINACYRRIYQLAEGVLVRREEVYRSYSTWGYPLIAAVKCNPHRLYLVYDEHQISKRSIVVYIHCCVKKTQKTPRKIIERCKSVRDFYFDNLSSMIDVEEEIEE